MSDPILVDAAAAIDTLADGGLYQFPSVTFNTPNVFATVAFTSNLVVKIAAQPWQEDFEKYAVHEVRDTVNPCVRSADVMETSRGVQNVLVRLPELQALFASDPKAGHFLVVHKLQYQRLLQANLVNIPATRFILLKRRRFGIFSTICPGIVQERVLGTSLLAMFDDVRNEVRPEWRHYVSAITPILNSLINSELRDHLNWFIANFIFKQETGALYYVDSKPSFLFARSGNERNIDGLQKYFGCS